MVCKSSLLWKSLFLGAIVLCSTLWLSTRPMATAKDGVQVATLDVLTAEIEALKKLLPDQSHAMADVGYHFTNLWFAGDASNWPLAEFYFNETRAHLEWAVRIKPVRQDHAKRDVELVKILQALENTPLKQLGAAIAAKDQQTFVAGYKATLEGCYACHKASEKPYLRPQIPQRPEAQIINSDPQATWPP
jgi:hypothetical protein